MSYFVLCFFSQRNNFEIHSWTVHQLTLPFFFKLPNSTLLLGHSIVCLSVVAIDTWDAELRLRGEGGGIFLSSEMHSVSCNDVTLHSERV